MAVNFDPQVAPSVQFVSLPHMEKLEPGAKGALRRWLLPTGHYVSTATEASMCIRTTIVPRALSTLHLFLLPARRPMAVYTFLISLIGSLILQLPALDCFARSAIAAAWFAIAAIVVAVLRPHRAPILSHITVASYALLAMIAALGAVIGTDTAESFARSSTLASARLAIILIMLVIAAIRGIYSIAMIIVEGRMVKERAAAWEESGFELDHPKSIERLEDNQDILEVIDPDDLKTIGKYQGGANQFSAESDELPDNQKQNEHLVAAAASAVWLNFDSQPVDDVNEIEDAKSDLVSVEGSGQATGGSKGISADRDHIDQEGLPNKSGSNNSEGKISGDPTPDNSARIVPDDLNVSSDDDEFLEEHNHQIGGHQINQEDPFDDDEFTSSASSEDNHRIEDALGDCEVPIDDLPRNDEEEELF
eukprot:GDKJ01002565.1.p1 GENE.GDKJ01002565.1~~GDKJ01002565.1.p1  ORF type:complete len:421 (+),score=40.41 GDKJ01002565.1:2-1264(+)